MMAANGDKPLLALNKHKKFLELVYLHSSADERKVSIIRNGARITDTHFMCTCEPLEALILVADLRLTGTHFFL